MKAARQRKIQELIHKRIIETQDELAEELKHQGFNVTQATVSRDIKELGLVKVATGDNRYRYAIPGERITPNELAKNKRIFSDSVISIDFSENIVVIKTSPGAAQSVALVIDNDECPEIIGTVAGDDTILVVIKPKKMVPVVIERFNLLLI